MQVQSLGQEDFLEKWAWKPTPVFLPGEVGMETHSSIFTWISGHVNPLQYFYLENTMDRGAWQATVHGVAESDMTEVT